ncbi:MAG: prolipoprotein diacylglyceryl transferase, partial [Patescibacteria group bacterium]
MFNFLHTFQPERILLNLGPFHIYWYGFFVVSGLLLGILVSLKLASYYKIEKNKIIDLIFWVILGGIIGARIYHIFLELPYYLNNPLDMIKIWQGGLAIHGAIIAGVLIIWYFSKKHNLNFWLISAILAPSLALAQAIGRWGNYFNQELFGLPTNLP